MIWVFSVKERPQKLDHWVCKPNSNNCFRPVLNPSPGLSLEWEFVFFCLFVFLISLKSTEVYIWNYEAGLLSPCEKHVKLTQSQRAWSTGTSWGWLRVPQSQDNTRLPVRLVRPATLKGVLGDDELRLHFWFRAAIWDAHLPKRKSPKEQLCPSNYDSRCIKLKWGNCVLWGKAFITTVQAHLSSLCTAWTSFVTFLENCQAMISLLYLDIF